MPLLIAPLVALSLGMYFGLLRAGSLGANGAALARRCAALYMLLCFFPVVAFAALIKPAWSWLHVLDSRPSSAINLIAAAAAAAFISVGHVAGRALGNLPRPRALAVAAVPAIASALVVLLLQRRFSLLEAATRHGESPLWGSRFGAGLVVLLLLLALGAWLTARAIETLDADAEAAPDDALTGPWGPLVAARRQALPKLRRGPPGGPR